MKKGLLMVALLVPAWASAAEVRVNIRGMVCAFCATGLKKTFGAEKGVQKVDVSLDDKRITITVDSPGVPTDDRIRELVKDAGYDVVRIDRPGTPSSAAEGKAP